MATKNFLKGWQQIEHAKMNNWIDAKLSLLNYPGISEIFSSFSMH